MSKIKISYIVLLALVFGSFANTAAAQTASERKAQALYFEAETAVGNKQYKTALTYADKAEDTLGANNALLESIRVRALYEMGQFESAKKALESFYAFDPSEALTRPLTSIIANIDEKIEAETQQRDEALRHRKKQSDGNRARRKEQKALSDQVGRIVWSVPSPTKNTAISSIAVLTDATILVSGMENEVYRLAADGIQIWQKELKDTKRISKIAAAKDAGFFVGQELNSKFSLAKFDIDGKLDWKWKAKRQHSSEYRTGVREILPTSDNGVAFVGLSWGDRVDYQVVYVGKLNAAGEESWLKWFRCPKKGVVVNPRLVETGSRHVSLFVTGCDNSRTIRTYSLADGSDRRRSAGPNTVNFFVSDDGLLVQRDRSTKVVQRSFSENGRNIPGITKQVISNRVINEAGRLDEPVEQDTYATNGPIAYLKEDGGIIYDKRGVQRIDGQGDIIWSKSVSTYYQNKGSFHIPPQFMSNGDGVVVTDKFRIKRIENLGLGKCKSDDCTTLSQPPKRKQVNLLDGDAEIVSRVPPIIPPQFLQGNNSGYCKVRFDIDEDGDPFNIFTTTCTNKVLSDAAIMSVQEWTYTPKISNSFAVVHEGVETTIRFNLADDNGNILPLPAGY